MRLYGKKFIHKFVKQQINQKKTTADAILWQVDTIRKKAIVKIQGTNENVIAHFPRNWKEYPYWLKPRNAVRIIWREGHRGYIEIAGEGRAIPTPVEGPTFPEVSAPGDHWITGGLLLPSSPESLNLIATGGTYVIDGETYFYNPELQVGGTQIIMDDPAHMIMGSGNYTMSMGTGQYTVTIDEAPPCYRYRYDAFVVGTDGVIDYLKGVEAANNPSKPIIPGGHILIGDYILVKPNVTQILAENIGEEWVEASISQIIVTYNEGSWNGQTGRDGDSEPIVSFSWRIYDQYGCTARAPSGSISVEVFGIPSVGEVSLSSLGPWTDSFLTSGLSGSFAHRIEYLDLVNQGFIGVYVVATYGEHSASGVWASLEQIGPYPGSLS
jgi:hypothetical protein